MTKLENAKNNVAFWQKLAKHNLVGTLIGGVSLLIGATAMCICGPEAGRSMREFKLWNDDVKFYENEQESCEETKES